MVEVSAWTAVLVQTQEVGVTRRSAHLRGPELLAQPHSGLHTTRVQSRCKRCCRMSRSTAVGSVMEVRQQVEPASQNGILLAVWGLLGRDEGLWLCEGPFGVVTLRGRERVV